MIARLLEQGWRGVGAVGEWQPVTALLESLYRQHWRFYHTATHIARCAAHFDRVRDVCDAEAQVALAIVFHDAVYVPGAPDNEEQSARLAASVLKAHRVSDPVVQRIDACIRATDHRQLPQKGTDAALMADIDLAILAAPPDEFDRYEADIRREYAFVTDPDFRAGRARILRRFLDRPHLYATRPFRDTCEQPARHNLERSLQRLGRR